MTQLTRRALSNNALVSLVAPPIPTRRPHPHSPSRGSSRSRSSTHDKHDPDLDTARARRPAAQQRAVRLRDRGADAARRRRRHFQRVRCLDGRVQRPWPARHVGLGRHVASAAVGPRRRAGHAADGGASCGQQRKGWREEESGGGGPVAWRGTLSDASWACPCWCREHVVLGWVGRAGRGFGLVAVWLMRGGPCTEYVVTWASGFSDHREGMHNKSAGGERDG